MVATAPTAMSILKIAATLAQRKELAVLDNHTACYMYTLHARSYRELPMGGNATVIVVPPIVRGSAPDVYNSARNHLELPLFPPRCRGPGGDSRVNLSIFVPLKRFTGADRCQLLHSTGEFGKQGAVYHRTLEAAVLAAKAAARAEPDQDPHNVTR